MANTDYTELKKWQDRINNGLRFQQKVGRMNEWARYKAYYRHEFRSQTLPVNMIFSILRSLTPQVVLRNPKVTVTPRKPGPEAELNARIVQKIDNWLLSELMAKRELKKIVQDCFFAGTATMFVGYDTYFGFDSDSADPTGQFSMSQFNKKGDRVETNKGVMPGMPWALRGRPEDVIFPWGASDSESLEWVAMRCFRRVTDLQKDKRYTNTKDLTGTITPVRTMAEGGISADWRDAMQFSPDPDARFVELFQVHDARSGKLYAFTMDSTGLLRADPDEMQVDGLPSETISFNPDPDYIYGIPDARIIEPQLLELVDIRTQAMRHRQMDLLKTMVKKGCLSEEEKGKLKSGNVNPMVELDFEGDIRSAVASFTPGISGILQDLSMQGSQVQGDIREMVGFSRVLQGEYQGKTHVSAAETDAVMQSLSIRLDERRDAMADMLGKVVKKWNALIFTHWTKERVESIVGPDGAQWWLKFTGPQIKDDYDLSVEPEEGMGLNTQAKRQELTQVAQTWAQLNEGLIKSGAPVPMEIQRALFGAFDDLGLDVDKLVAQTQGMAQQAQHAQQMQQAMGGMGGSAQNPISPGLLANLQKGGKRPPQAGGLR